MIDLYLSLSRQYYAFANLGEQAEVNKIHFSNVDIPQIEMDINLY